MSRRSEGSPSRGGDENRPSTSAGSQRHGYYASQRVERPRSRPTGDATQQASASTSKRQGKDASYDEPQDFSNIGESGGSPPVDDPAGKQSYRLESTLKESAGGTGRLSPQKQRPNSPRKRRSFSADEQELTEVAGPPPVPETTDARHEKRIQRRHFYEDFGADGDVESDGSGAPPPSMPQTPPDGARRRPATEDIPKALTELYTISYLIFFSLMGTLARLGVQWLTFYPGAPVTTPVIWANFGGSMIMGFLSEDQGLFRNVTHAPTPNGGPQDGEKPQRRRSRIQDDIDAAATKDGIAKRKKTIPLYIGLATGFCGSFTSFSSFARDFFLALSNALPSPIDHPLPTGVSSSTTTTMHRDGGYSFLAFLAVVLQTLTLSIGGMIAGAQIAVFLDPYTPYLPVNFVRRFLDRAMVFLAFGCWLGAVFLAIWPPDRPGGPASRGPWMNETWRGEAIMALVFAPPGCLLRFYASIKLNGLVPAFPLGTFTANMLGTAVEGMCYDIQHVGVGVMGGIGGGRVGCQVLQGVQDGFCGCLTTVSTWVTEINGLKRKHGWAYAFASLLGGLCLMVVIMGSVKWSVGWSSPACNTGYPNKIHG